MYASKLTGYKKLINRKQMMYGELLNQVQTLMTYNDQIIKNENEKLYLQMEIDTNIVELEQVRTLAKELSD